MHLVKSDSHDRIALRKLAASVKTAPQPWQHISYFQVGKKQVVLVGATGADFIWGVGALSGINGFAGATGAIGDFGGFGAIGFGTSFGTGVGVGEMLLFFVGVVGLADIKSFHAETMTWRSSFATCCDFGRRG